MALVRTGSRVAVGRLPRNITFLWDTLLKVCPKIVLNRDGPAQFL
jgi:hypothetical protein